MARMVVESNKNIARVISKAMDEYISPGQEMNRGQCYKYGNGGQTGQTGQTTH